MPSQPTGHGQPPISGARINPKCLAPSSAVPHKMPLSGPVEDLVMVDRTQAAIFGALGQTRSAFLGIAKWPTLSEVFRTHSRRFLKLYGETEFGHALKL